MDGDGSPPLTRNDYVASVRVFAVRSRAVHDGHDQPETPEDSVNVVRSKINPRLAFRHPAAVSGQLPSP
jgi:hypothetical protein